MERRLYGQDSLFQTINELMKDPPHLFITGPPGCGKTTFLEDIIDILRKEEFFKLDSILWLSSEKDRGIHTIRDKVNDFCKRSHSKPNTLRWIIIDDADTLPLISQQALRRPMETFNHLTRFIFASRHAGHLIEPLRSRCLTLELEHIGPSDIIKLYTQKYEIPETNVADKLFMFCLQNFCSIYEIKSIIRLFKTFLLKGISPEDSINKLYNLLPSSHSFTQALITSLSSKDEDKIRSSITSLYLNGYLLDDILLSVEKSIKIFPSIDPTIRFRILKFTMLGWISIQQGKEHWLDAMDIVEQILN
jgi:predicted AAA+ superfamily ATPase